MVAEAPDGPRRRRRRRPDGGADPQPRHPDARHRRHHPAPPGRGDPGARRAASPRSPAAPVPARPWWPCTAPPTCSTATGAASSPAASSSSAPPRPTPRTSSGCCRRLGEETVTLRSLGDVVDAVSAERLDTPAAAAIKGPADPSGAVAGRPRRRAGRRRTEFRAFVAGIAVRLDAPRPRPGAVARAAAAPAQPRPRRRRPAARRRRLPAERAPGEREEFVGRFEDHLEVATFLERWWPQLDPREVLLWLADDGHGWPATRKGVLDDEERAQLLASMRLGPGDRRLVGRRRRARRRRRRAAGPGPGRPARGARLLRDRGARRPVLARRLRAGRPGAPRPGRTRSTP